MRGLTIGFFHTTSPIAKTIRAKIKDFAANPHPHDKSRTVQIDVDTPAILRNIHLEAGGHYLLDFTRIRNVNGQPLSDLEANEEHLSFKDKRPAEFTVAMLDLETGVLALHESLQGMTANMVARYWQKIIPEMPKFRFDPIIEQRAADIIATTGAFSKFSVSLAHMGNQAHLKKLGLTDNEIIDLIPYYSAPSINVIMKAEPAKDKNTLNVTRIRSLVKALLPLPKENLKRLSLVAEDEDGDSFPINLLKDRIVERVDLSFKEAQEVTHEVRYRAIRDGWGRRRNELRKRYASIQ